MTALSGISTIRLNQTMPMPRPTPEPTLSAPDAARRALAPCAAHRSPACVRPGRPLSRCLAGVLLDLGDDAGVLVEERVTRGGPTAEVFLDGQQLGRRREGVGRIVGTLDLDARDRVVQRPEALLDELRLAGIAE